ncbi:hypothetical protein THIOKS13150006 [Thiocapsa sp. KS1]|nr:hypothetical protein THIOKS13150006 [Thiocapsa sp. KS1]
MLANMPTRRTSLSYRIGAGVDALPGRRELRIYAARNAHLIRDLAQPPSAADAAWAESEPRPGPGARACRRSRRGG